MSTRGFTVMVGLGIVVLGVALTKEVIRKIQIRQQITELETEIASLETHNTELNQMIQYFNSSSFQEKEARTKLGLTAAGETMVVLPNNSTGQPNGVDQAVDSRINQDQRSNLAKWQAYFFSE